MLGAEIGHEEGQIIGRRVLDAEGPKIENTFNAEGSFRGIDINDLGTYWTIVRPEGVLYGEGQGVLTSRDGQIVTWTAQGVGRFISPRVIRFRGSTFYRSASRGSLNFLNNMMAVFEFEVDEQGNTTARNWEWEF
jgi:hypothetical protein